MLKLYCIYNNRGDDYSSSPKNINNYLFVDSIGNSLKDNIVIEADENHYISKITINGEEINVINDKKRRKRINMKIKNYLITIIGILICSISFCVFFAPYGIVPSGAAGISIIFNKLFNLNEVITIVLLSTMFLIIGCLFLDRRDVRKAILGTVLFPLFIYLFRYFITKIDLSIDNNLLTSIVGGVSLGFGLGLIYREDHFIGGLDILNRIIDRNININYSMITLVTDILVVIFGGIVFGFEAFVYSMISIFIYRLMIEKIIIGVGDNRSFYIITTHAEEIKKMVTEELGHGATIIKGRGAYSYDDKYIVFVAIPKRDYYKLKEGIKRIDKDAFFVVSSSYEVGGGK